MKKVVIYMEGPSDYHIIAGLLMRFHNTKKRPKPMSDETTWILEREVEGVVDLRVELRCGKADSNEATSDVTPFTHPTECSKLKEQVIESIEKGTINLFIIDADIDIDERRIEVRNAHQSELFDVDSCVFFWPDNSTSGEEFEHLLPDIANVPGVFTCWKRFHDCVLEIDSDSIGTKNQRAKVLRKHVYWFYNALVSNRNQVGQWDFEKPRIQPMIQFLNRHLN